MTNLEEIYVLTENGTLWRKSYETRCINEYQCLDWNPDNVLAVKNGSWVYVYDEQGELLWRYNCTEEVAFIAWSPSGNLLAVVTEHKLWVFNSRGELLWNYSPDSWLSAWDGTCLLYTSPSPRDRG